MLASSQAQYLIDPPSNAATIDGQICSGDFENYFMVPSAVSQSSGLMVSLRQHLLAERVNMARTWHGVDRKDSHSWVARRC